MKYIFPFIALLLSYFAYSKTRDVTFKSADGVLLSGTVYLPKGVGPFPAVVFVHGSGQETRKNSSYSAKWLASLGYVALAYDKRGVGKSGGNESFSNRFSFKTLASDVVAAVNHVKSMPEVDAAKIGLHATSQGGWVAPLAVASSSSISFMIIKSASVCTLEEDRIFERAARLKSEGFAEEDLLEVREIQLHEPKYLNANEEDKFIELFEKYRSKPWFGRVYPDGPPESLDSYRLWYGTIAKYDPIVFLEKINTPIFWIFGDKDLDGLGPVKLSIKNLSILEEEGKKYQVHSYGGEGHNVAEKKYELDLFKWLQKINDQHSKEFKKH